MGSKKIILIAVLAIIVLLAIIFIADSVSNTSSTSSGNKVVLTDRTFVTRINDMIQNPEKYYGREVEIEGFRLTRDGVTSIARYGTGCCVDDEYALFIYEYDKEIDIVDVEDWIKVTGVVKRKTDSNGDYAYIQATNIEKMDTRGQDKVW